jgi:hypothetical protein
LIIAWACLRNPVLGEEKQTQGSVEKQAQGMEHSSAVVLAYLLVKVLEARWILALEPTHLPVRPPQKGRLGTYDGRVSPPR